MRLIDVLRGKTDSAPDRSRGSFGPFSWPKSGFSFNGIGYGPELIQSMPKSKTKEFSDDFFGHFAAAVDCPPVFAAQNKRARYLSQARFKFRNLSTRELFGTTALELLEKPWVGGNTAELIAKMEWHAGLAGNAYVVRQYDQRGRPFLKVANPQWMSILLGSQREPDDPAWALDAERPAA